MSGMAGGEVKVSIGAAFSSSFTSAFKSADSQISALGSTVRRLDSQLASMDGFRALQDDTEATARAWRESDAELRSFSQHLAGLDSISDEQKRKFKELENQTKALKRRMEESSAAVDKAGKDLREAGVDTNQLTAEQRRLEQQLGRTTRQMEAMGQIAGAGIGQAFAGVRSELGSLATQATVAGAAIGYTFKTQFVDVAAEFEKFQTILETTEGSQAGAAKAMQWVSDFAAKTPYELAQVTDAFVKLRAYGMDPTSGLLKTLGDTSAAMGKDMMQAVEAVADAVTGENERLKEFGVKASKSGGQITYEYTTKEGKQATATVDAENRAAIQSTLEAIFNQKYAGAMDKLSGTWGGMISNLGDQWTRFTNMVMESGVFRNMKAKLGGVLDQINVWAADGTLARWAEEAGQKIGQIIDGVWDLGKALWNGASAVAEFVGGWQNLGIILVGLKLVPLALSVWQLGSALFTAGAGIVKLVAAGGSLSGLFGALGPLVSGFGAALAATPIGWLVAGLAAVAGGLYLVWTYWDQIVAFGTGVWDGFASALEPIGVNLGWVGDAFGVIVGWVADLVNWFGSLLPAVDSTAAGLDTARNAGAQFGEVLAGVFNFVTAPARLLLEVIGQIVDKISWVIDNAGKLGAVYDSAAAKVTGAWDSTVGGVSSFLGLGSDEAPADVGAAGAAPVVPAAPGSSSTTTNTTTNQITIQGASDPQATARAVSEELDHRERANARDRRSSMTDSVAY